MQEKIDHARRTLLGALAWALAGCGVRSKHFLFGEPEDNSMSFALVQKTAYATVNGASPSQAFSQPCVAGNLLIAFITAPGSNMGPMSGGLNPYLTDTGTSVTDTLGNTWKRAGWYASGGISGIWYCESAIAGTPTVTFNIGTSRTAAVAFSISLAEYSGHLASHPLHIAGGSSSAAQQPQGGAYVPCAGCLIVNQWTTNGPTVTWGSPSGITPQTATSSQIRVWGDNQNSSAGDNHMSMDVGAGPDTIGSMAVFLPANYQPPGSYAFVRGTSGSSGGRNGAQCYAGFDGGNQGGNLILVAIVICSTQSNLITGVTDSAGNSYSQIAAVQLDNQLHDYLVVYACQNCADTKNYNGILVQASGAPGNGFAVQAYEYSGQLRVGSIVDTTATVNPASTNLAKSITAAAAGELLFELGSHGAGGVTWSGLGGSQTDRSYFNDEYSNMWGVDQGAGFFGGSHQLPAYVDDMISASGSNSLSLSASSGASALIVALKAAPAASAPTFTPASGGASTVALSTSSTGATIYYTTDGSTPTTASAIYSSPIAISLPNTTIKAIAANNGFSSSTVASSTFSPPAGANSMMLMGVGT